MLFVREGRPKSSHGGDLQILRGLLDHEVTSKPSLDNQWQPMHLAIRG
jgi:hypothetical protein